MINILVVEDDYCLRQYLVQRLAELSLGVTEAESANQAINLMEQGHKYGLIVSDYNMPDGDGKKLQSYLVDSKSVSLFIFFSSELNIQLNMAHQHFLGVVAKPNLEQLLNKVSLIFSSGLRSEA